MVEGGGLENRCRETYRGFESLLLRQLHCADEGGHRAATRYSIIASCERGGVDPAAYIADVLSKLAHGWKAGFRRVWVARRATYG